MTRPAPERFPAARAAAILLFVAALLAAAATFALPTIGWEPHVQPATLGLIVCAAAALVALIPVWYLDRTMKGGAAYGFMAGILVRLAICAAAVLILQRSDSKEAGLVGYWTAGWYLVFLWVEVALVAGYVKRSMLPADPTASDNATEVRPC